MRMAHAALKRIERGKQSRAMREEAKQNSGPLTRRCLAATKTLCPQTQHRSKTMLILRGTRALKRRSLRPLLSTPLLHTPAAPTVPYTAHPAAPGCAPASLAHRSTQPRKRCAAPLLCYAPSYPSHRTMLAPRHAALCYTVPCCAALRCVCCTPPTSVRPTPSEGSATMAGAV